jgi:hypothetical protein
LSIDEMLGLLAKPDNAILAIAGCGGRAFGRRVRFGKAHLRSASAGTWVLDPRSGAEMTYDKLLLGIVRGWKALATNVRTDRSYSRQLDERCRDVKD